MAAGSMSTAIGGRSRPILKEPDDMKTLFVTIALAIASPALAWDNNQFSEALQNYELDQQLNNLARQATQSNQNTFNQNPIFHQPTYSGCTPAAWAWCR
jgi:hypothetical protein